MKSPKELSLDRKILRQLTGDSLRIAEILLSDEEIHHLQEYGNSVSIKRLGFNDHGPVHMRKVVLNAMLMMDLLHQGNVKTSLEQEESGTFEDSRAAVLLASFLHDLGMTIGRERHEEHSAFLAMPIMDRILKEVYPDGIARRVVIRSVALEGIVGHMANRRIHSLEAGIILVADGCDMEKGRARIPMMMATRSRVGDIHKYSSNSIERVDIGKGESRPIRISITMTTDVGFFQVEEVLLNKVASSPAKPYIELFAGVRGEAPKQYL